MSSAARLTASPPDAYLSDAEESEGEVVTP